MTGATTTKISLHQLLDDEHYQALHEAFDEAMAERTPEEIAEILMLLQAPGHFTNLCDRYPLPKK